MAFGLSETGFDKKRLPDILTEISQEFVDFFGNISTEPESIAGQIIAIMADREASIWEELENVYLSQFRSSAEGKSLDNVGQLIGVDRLPATASFVTVALFGDEATVVPALTQGQVSDNDEVFELETETTITESSQIQTTISVADIHFGTPTLYKITVSSPLLATSPLDVSFMSDATATANKIILGLVAAAISTVPAALTAVDNFDGTMTWTSFDKKTAYGLVLFNGVGVDLDYDVLGTPGLFNSVNLGPIKALVNSLTTVITPVTGLDDINNLLDATLGRAIEGDTAYRTRIATSVNIFGAATVEAIQARLLSEVVGVTSVKVFENRGDTVDGAGRPGHSFEAVVSGGADQAIGDKIWFDLKGAGIETTFGTPTPGPPDVEVTVVDSNGDNQIIKFSRPTNVTIFITVKVTKSTSPETPFPSDGITLIEKAILDFGNKTYQIGDDILVEQWYVPIFSIPGVASAFIDQDKVSQPATPSANGPNLILAETELGTFDAIRIVVTAV